MEDELTTKRHKAEIVATLTPYLMALPQSKINEGSLVVYANALSALSIAEIDAAMLKLMRTMKFFPTVAEIFEQAGDVKSFAMKTEIRSADEAWHEAMKLAHDKFLYSEWTYSCKEVEQAVKNFGKRELCALDNDDVNTARAQFMRIYNSITTRKKNNQANIAVLNAMPQQKVQELIGNVSRNFEVLEGGAV